MAYSRRVDRCLFGGGCWKKKVKYLPVHLCNHVMFLNRLLCNSTIHIYTCTDAVAVLLPRSTAEGSFGVHKSESQILFPLSFSSKPFTFGSIHAA